MTVSVQALSAANGARWRGCVTLGSRMSAFSMVAARLLQAEAKKTYQDIEAATKVPWFVVAVIHERESSQNFTRSIAQGDPWNAKSIHVPRGRGPFASFKDAAYDALVDCAPKAARWTDWSIGGILTILEEYNGLGYAAMSRPSPYIWAGTNQYHSGKYVADGHYDANVIDTQLGCAGMLMAMAATDKSVSFVGTPPVNAPTARLSPSKPVVPVVPTVHDAPPLQPSVTNPAPGSIGASIAHLLGELFHNI